ncbi:hypothetical protein HLH33_17815 [Gluconacetobacter diazotrophicus]|uniref:Uncharacterized protein n=1 Tax=Gluconacetobacter diazotrophicus TaxID=33996 RepID=A0A7W4NPF9_GLUDI|nr:hypothetical protein [Gluconacetobacter diazotrophicus]MBB2158130.1 hypothetical protein [Gluconacetobacter diazotrophicus]
MIEYLSEGDWSLVNGGLSDGGLGRDQWVSDGTLDVSGLGLEANGMGGGIAMLAAEAECRAYRSEGYSVTFQEVMEAVNGDNSLLPAALR